MSRTVRWVLAVITGQAALIGIYWLVEHRMAHDPNAARRLGTEPGQPVDIAVPPLTVRRRDGSSVELRSRGRATLVHVWATWCPPCRAELPGLLELPAAHAVDVVAIALDKDWDAVDQFLGRLDAANVFLADGDVEHALGVRSLPVTFLLRDDNRVTLRFDGARDWTSKSFIATWLDATGNQR